MTRYLVGRLAEMLAVLLLMSAVVFVLIGLMPGDPVDLMIAGDPKMTTEDAARLRALYGLDRPIAARYLSWLGSALGGDLGYSRSFSRPVLDVLLPRLADTLLLMGLALLISAAIALPVGMLAARRPRSTIDYGVNLLCFAGISVPPFWLALLLIMAFSVLLGWLPASGVGEGLVDRVRHLAMPLAVLVLTNVGHYTRFVRAATIEVLRQDHIRTARAKGLSERDVVRRHALRGALAPTFTVLALSFGGLFSGALITETMFGRPGMGKAIYDAIMGNDYNLALVGLLIATAATLAGSLLADLGYAWLDPRVRLQGDR
ncbi:ABC transporter permease [Reyranella sp. CPCC 100927]|uniref:ABC transporter permease n=1 Tax=Reyranella sp. CPCC 100927 TaxID=2599616 RepID=UPI0011B68717|nr:ABC transporter permease [Reyranella sp. CPCC 100927]TWT05652.1 ABC transporter permease [Reyranella sp. CPCC 100927]